MFCIDSVDIDSIECIRDPCLVLTVRTTYICIDSMVEKPSVSAFQNFLQIENQLYICTIYSILRKLWAGMCGCVLTVVSTVSTNLNFNALLALIFNIDSVDKKDTTLNPIHNSIALIFCIDCLDTSFNVHSEIQCRF